MARRAQFSLQGRQAFYLALLLAPPLLWLGIVYLGSLITLTPGTTTVDIDMEERRLLVHLLDTRGADSARAEIRSDFEKPIRVPSRSRITVGAGWSCRSTSFMPKCWQYHADAVSRSVTSTPTWYRFVAVTSGKLARSPR